MLLKNCISVITPTRLRPVDIEFMKTTCKLVNIIPVIAKVDTMTTQECKKLKVKVCLEFCWTLVKIHEVYLKCSSQFFFVCGLTSRYQLVPIPFRKSKSCKIKSASTKIHHENFVSYCSPISDYWRLWKARYFYLQPRTVWFAERGTSFTHFVFSIIRKTTDIWVNFNLPFATDVNLGTCFQGVEKSNGNPTVQFIVIVSNVHLAAMNIC